MEYTTQLKTLDCIYLDTSNLGPSSFPSKADGLKELLLKVAKYPKDTVFHFSAWTFGYEEVWMALSKILNSPVSTNLFDYISIVNLCRFMWIVTRCGFMRLSEEVPAKVNTVAHSLPLMALF